MSESERLCSKLLNRLKDIGSAAVALSGGVDSCFLAYAASLVEGGNFAAYYVQSAFQPEFELTDALRAAKEAELPFKIISVDILACEDVVRNPTDRCCHCRSLHQGSELYASCDPGADLRCLVRLRHRL